MNGAVGSLPGTILPAAAVQNFGGLTAPQVFGPMVAGFNATGVPVRYIMVRQCTVPLPC
jgi:hypothetical protein